MTSLIPRGISVSISLLAMARAALAPASADSLPIIHLALFNGLFQYCFKETINEASWDQYAFL